MMIVADYRGRWRHFNAWPGLVQHVAGCVIISFTARLENRDYLPKRTESTPGEVEHARGGRGMRESCKTQIRAFALLGRTYEAQ